MTQRGGSTSVRARHVLLVIAYLVFWLLPMAYRGLTRNQHLIPAYPVFLRYLHSASCLFTHRPASWPVLYMQLSLQEEDGEWLTLPDEPFFQMPPFGYRVRLDEFYRMRMHRYPLARRELADWIRDRYQQLHPDEPSAIAFRIVEGHYRPRRDVPPGHWKKPPLNAFAPEDLGVLYTSRFE